MELKVTIMMKGFVNARHSSLCLSTAHVQRWDIEKGRPSMKPFFSLVGDAALDFESQFLYSGGRSHIAFRSSSPVLTVWLCKMQQLIFLYALYKYQDLY